MSKNRKGKEQLEATKSQQLSADANSDSNEMLYGKSQFIWMLGGFGLMVIGYFLMSGGHMPSPDVWDDSIIYSFRRTVLAPIFILTGLGIEIYAIFKK